MSIGLVSELATHSDYSQTVLYAVTPPKLAPTSGFTNPRICQPVRIDQESRFRGEILSAWYIVEAIDL
jgi:hypothetical protein